MIKVNLVNGGVVYLSPKRVDAIVYETQMPNECGVLMSAGVYYRVRGEADEVAASLGRADRLCGSPIPRAPRGDDPCSGEP